jgi:hypothetical protein
MAPVASPGQCSSNIINNSGSDNTASDAARSSGNSRTSIGNVSSHNDCGWPAQSVSTQTPLDDQHPTHLQAILTVTADGPTPGRCSATSKQIARANAPQHEGLSQVSGNEAFSRDEQVIGLT